jgi:Holliday junction resolvase RusA-like endonuclease
MEKKDVDNSLKRCNNARHKGDYMSDDSRTLEELEENEAGLLEIEDKVELLEIKDNIHPRHNRVN